MTKFLLMVMLVSVVMFYTACPIFSQIIDPYSYKVPENVAESPTSDFEIYVESPDEAPFKEADSPAMEYDKELAHHYLQKQLEFLKASGKKQSTKCGDEIFKNMLVETSQIANKFCHDILKIGKDYHLGLVKTLFSSNEYKIFASKDIPKSKQTRDDCVHRVGSNIGAPTSLEP